MDADGDAVDAIFEGKVDDVFCLWRECFARALHCHSSRFQDKRWGGELGDDEGFAAMGMRMGMGRMEMEMGLGLGLGYIVGGGRSGT